MHAFNADWLQQQNITPLLLAKNKKLRLHFKLAGEQAELGDA